MIVTMCRLLFLVLRMLLLLMFPLIRLAIGRCYDCCGYGGCHSDCVCDLDGCRCRWLFFCSPSLEDNGNSRRHSTICRMVPVDVNSRRNARFSRGPKNDPARIPTKLATVNSALRVPRSAIKSLVPSTSRSPCAVLCSPRMTHVMSFSFHLLWLCLGFLRGSCGRVHHQPKRIHLLCHGLSPGFKLRHDGQEDSSGSTTSLMLPKRTAVSFRCSPTKIYGSTQLLALSQRENVYSNAAVKRFPVPVDHRRSKSFMRPNSSSLTVSISYTCTKL